MNDDPTRLLDADVDTGSTASTLASLLEAGKSELPNDAQLAALAAKVGIATAVGASGAAAAGHAGKFGLKALVGKWLAASAGAKVSAVLVVGAVSAGGALAVRHATAPHTAVHLAPQPGGGGAVGIATTAPPQAVGEPPPADEPVVPSAALNLPAQPKPPRREPMPTLPVDEVALLDQALSAVRTDPSRALALCAEHARRFPSGQFAQEREVLTVEALVKSGRKQEAEERARRFRVQYPSSSHQRRIDALLEE